MVTRRSVFLALGASALAVPSPSIARAGIPHVDYLSQGSAADRGVFLGAFRDGLREFGWIDGKNVVIDVHWAPAHEFPQLAASLVRRDPAAIVGTCIPSTRAAKNATATIPVVMSVNGDPVESGLVASLARPGANVTGDGRCVFPERDCAHRGAGEPVQAAGLYGFREYVEAGGLVSCGLSYRDYYRGVARYVDRVLRGTKPADLPVQQPAKIELVINQRTAKAMGLTIPASMLARADGVIE